MIWNKWNWTPISDAKVVESLNVKDETVKTLKHSIVYYLHDLRTLEDFQEEGGAENRDEKGNDWCDHIKIKNFHKSERQHKKN